MRRGILVGVTVVGVLAIVAAALAVYRGALAPQPVRPGAIPVGAVDPAAWGKVYPLEYESWRRTGEPRPAGKSRYKPGWDTDRVIYDKLSMYPFLALLYRGWGMGLEYNEPRGHYYMMADQLEVDPARVKPGGACLTCKSPYIGSLLEQYGPSFLQIPYAEAVDKIPAEHRTLGLACADCHDPATMDLRVSRWTILKGLAALGKKEPTRQEMRSIVCGQCHVTYVITRDEQMKPVDVVFPWAGSRWGDVSVENIIKEIRSSPANLEWVQEVTGFKLGFIRHPEFEFYTRNSVHWRAGVACADCHMPYVRVGTAKISDHNVMSPLKNDLRACLQCHVGPAEELREQVLAIQDRTAALLIRAGYATATVAKLFELAHRERDRGRSLDRELYERAREHYLEAFYRVVYLAAENSMGFHNPSEAGRIAGDALAFAGRAEACLRQMLAASGVMVPEHVNLELARYLQNRGAKHLDFRPEQEVRDPTGLQDLFLPPAFRGLP